MVSIYMILFFISFRELGASTFGFWNENLEYTLTAVILYMMLLTGLLTLISGISFLVKNKRFFNNAAH